MKSRLLAVCIPAIIGAGFLPLGARAVKNNVGRQLPELHLAFVGEKPALAGKPLLLDFWATWCEPCREGVQALNGIRDTYKDRGLVVIGITREEEAAVKAFVREVPVRYFVGRDPSAELAAHLGITGIPHALLVDRNGRITWEGHPQTMQPGDIETLLK